MDEREIEVHPSVTMATMKYKGSTFSGINQSQNKHELSSDVHQKMSKKIAQLTKVICTLNTKNDEHDNIVDVIKMAHEKEIATMLEETKKKISRFKDQIDNTAKQEQLIVQLKQQLSQYCEEKKQFVTDFEKFKEKCQIERREVEDGYRKKYEDLQTDFQEKITSTVAKTKEIEQQIKAEFKLAHDTAVESITKQQKIKLGGDDVKAQDRE